MNLLDLCISEKLIRGSLFGSANAWAGIPMLDFYRGGKLKLDERVMKRYSFDEIKRGLYGHARGRALRAVVLTPNHEHLVTCEH